tara:strand:- start:494 stop:712 length:219 start_codon:yes stop_codon:yes gene_type:complete
MEIVVMIKYLPVEGCEECEFFENACPECIEYGEAKVAPQQDPTEHDIDQDTYDQHDEDIWRNEAMIERGRFQ